MTLFQLDRPDDGEVTGNYVSRPAKRSTPCAKKLAAAEACLLRVLIRHSRRRVDTDKRSE